MELKHAKLIVNHPPEKHAFASPSKLESLALCPYMARNCQGREEAPSPAAERGRMLHEAVVNDKIYDGLSLADRAEVDYLREDILSFDVEGYTVEFEVLVNIKDDSTNEVVSFGTCDIIVHKDDWTEALVIDNKTGKWMVAEAKNNRQLYGYALGLFQEHPELQRVGLQIKQFSHAGENDGIATYTRKEYGRLYEEVIPIIITANEATEADANPGTDACKFCWQENCKAYMDSVKEGFSLAEYQIPDLPLPEKAKVCNEVLNKCAATQTFLKRIEAVAKAVILENGGSEDYAVTKARSSKTTNWKAVAQECGIPAEVIDKHTVTKVSEPYVVRKGGKR